MQTFDQSAQVALWPALAPFTNQPPFRRPVAAGRTVAEVVRETLNGHKKLIACAVVRIGPDLIPRGVWHCVRLKAGTTIDLRCVPQGGGGGKNPLATILSIGLLAVAPALGGMLAGSLGLAGTGLWMGTTFMSAGTLLGGAIAIAGRLLISALLPPAKARTSSSSSTSAQNFISGAANRLAPFEAIPVILGKHRTYPPYAARPYTETVGNDQYIRMLFLLGYGPVEMSDLKIGETAISEFSEVEWEFVQNYDGVSQVGLYSNDAPQDEYNVLIEQSEGWIVRTTRTNADEIGLDITFPQGLVRFTSSGGQAERAVELEVQYSKTGEDDWSAGAGSFKPIAAQTSPVMAQPSGSSGLYGRKLRVYRVVMDEASGALSTVYGSITTVGRQEEDVPAVPSGRLPVAQVWRYSDDADTIAAGRIIDERGASLTDGTFEDAGSFLPGTSISANRISVAAGGMKYAGIYIKAKQGGALRRSVSFKVPERGQYDIRIRRLTADTDSTTIFDDAYLTGIRTVRYSNPVRRAGVSLLAVRIKATDQLNGVPDNINLVVQSIVPDWDEVLQEWVTRPANNPASLYRYVLQGAPNAKAVTDDWLNLPQIEEWAEWCAENEFTYNAELASQMSVQDLLKEIAAAGRAAPSAPELRWGVIRERENAVPVQMFTPANSWDFSGTLNYPDVPDALRVRFLNEEKGYEADEVIVYNDGFDDTNAQNYEGIDATGVTNYKQAWRFGRYYLANVILRPETYSFTADMDALKCTRGDVVRVQHDAILVGLGSGWIKSVQTNGAGDITGITLDDVVTMVAGKNYAVRIRQANGTQVYRNVVRVVGDQTALIFSTALPVTDPDDAPAAGDLFGFGEVGTETLTAVIKSITYDEDFRAELSCVDYAPAIHSADTGTIPPHNSVITIPPELQRPPQPVLVSFQSDEQVLIRNPDGSFTAVAVLTLAPVGWPLPLTPELKLKGVDETDYYSPAYTVTGNKITIFGLETGQYYDIRVIYSNPAGQSSIPLTLSGQKVSGDENPPADVDGFRLSILSGTAYLQWDEVTDIDLAYYSIRFNPATDGSATWENSVDLFPSLGKGQTTVAAPSRDGTYLIKAFDLGGRASENAALLISRVGNVLGMNVIETLDGEAPDFEGVHENTVVVLETLQLAEDETEGVYYFAESVDLGDVYTSLVTASSAVTGILRNDNVDFWPNWDLVANVDGGADPATWSIQLQVRTTNDDPAGTPVWGAWENLIVSEYTARAFEFRVILRAEDSNVTPAISDLSVQIDMPDRVDGGRMATSLDTDAPDTRIDFVHPFNAVPAVAVSPIDMQTGDYSEVTAVDKAGFNVRFFSAGAARVTRTFDWIAKGYGKMVTAEETEE